MVSMRGPRDTYKIEVIPIVEEHIPSFRSCLDSVARERVYLGMTKAPPIDSTFEFVRSNIKNNYPQFVAVEENRVVGWCDIIPRKGEGFTHSGTLGTGVLEGYRGQGLGNRLMDATIEAARNFGVERVELEVYASNTRGIRMYEKWVFVREGVKKRARKLDGVYEDIIVMALFL